MPKQICSIKKKDLINVLQESGLPFSEVRSEEIIGSKYFNVYFRSEDDMSKMCGYLNMRKFSHLFLKIQDYRVNVDKLMIFIVPHNS